MDEGLGKLATGKEVKSPPKERRGGFASMSLMDWHLSGDAIDFKKGGWKFEVVESNYDKMAELWKKSDTKNKKRRQVLKRLGRKQSSGVANKTLVSELGVDANVKIGDFKKEKCESETVETKYR